MEFDLTSIIQENIGTVVSSISGIAAAVVSALFLRKRTRVEEGTKEFEKNKAAKFNEIADRLMDEGYLTYSDYAKIKNYQKIAKIADKYRKDEEIPKQEFEWHVRFFEECGNVNDELLCEMWARLLSNEVSEPGTVSFRTLETLKNLSSREARLFSKACGCAVRVGNNVSIINVGNVMKNQGVSFEDILKLDDCGLIKSDLGVSIDATVGDNGCLMPLDEGRVVVIKKKNNEDKRVVKLSIPQYIFTTAGRNLFPITGKKMEIEKLLEVLNSNYANYSFQIAQVIANNGGKITYAMASITEVKVE